MFTGIVEETGSVAAVERGTRSSRMYVRGEKIFSDLALGDSVSVNGVCLTADAIDGHVFAADVCF